MENQIAKSYGRYLYLEGQVPELEEQIGNVTEQVNVWKYDMNWRQTEVMRLENPGFLDRMLGRAERKKEKAVSELRESRATYEIAKRKQEELEFQLKQVKEEMESLAGSREEYAQAGCPKEVAAFLPAAFAAAERCIGALNNMLPHARRDAVTDRVRPGNRKMEFMQKAAENARVLTQVLGLMPEGIAELGSYFEYPEHYITAVTSEYKQLDRVEMAMNQVKAVRSKLMKFSLTGK